MSLDFVDEEDLEVLDDSMEDLLELFSASYSSMMPTSYFKMSAFLSFLVIIFCKPMNDVLTGLLMV